MNVERFKEEFSELRRRFTATDCNKNDQTVAAPLTNQEILEAVHEVLDLKLDVTLVDTMRYDVKTPASGIVITTPDAPDIPKINIEHNGGIPGRFRSLDTLTSESLSDSPVDDLILPEPGTLMPKVENMYLVVSTDGSDAPDNEKKYMSKSNPAIGTLVRSDTFVRDDELGSVKNGDVFEEKNIRSVATNGFGIEQSMTEVNLTEIFMKLTAFKDSIIEVVKKIDDIQNGVPEKSRPTRRLTSMGCFPGLNRISTTAKTTQRSKITRRSMAAFPGTPTSSRLSPGAAESKIDSIRRKSTSALSLVNNASALKLSIPPAYRSISSGAIVVPKKSQIHSDQVQESQMSEFKAPKTPAVRPPALSLLNVANQSTVYQTKNPKYAHVQSTIPKPGITLGKRKAT